MSKNIHIFTHNDLDGAGSLLALIWAFPEDKITYTTVNNNKASNFTNFITTEWGKTLSDYDSVFIVDLSLPEKDIHCIDKNNVIFIDHHKTSLPLKFNNAKSFIKVYSSCAMYIYNIFKNIIDISKKQKELLVYIDDYDSYTLNFKTSKDLNILFWDYYSTTISTFLSDYSEGFVPFTELQKNIISFNKQKLQKLTTSLNFYSASISVQSKTCKIVSTFADTFINDVAEHIFQKYKADIAIVVSLEQSRVSFRRRKGLEVDVSALSQKLCDGGGHEAASGGKITDKFLSFSKMFTPINDSTTLS
jgi:oligoribonuclease NrnB/cAMP/cGMP phosphodiesterase (DHH superfamily)